LVEGGLGMVLVPDLWQNLVPRVVEFRRLHGIPKNRIGLAFACRRDEEGAVLVRACRNLIDTTVADRE
jgi:hypothetical protein